LSRLVGKNGWKPWTPEDVQELRALAWMKLPKEAIGMRMGRTPAAIVQRAWQERIPLAGRRPRRSAHDDARALPATDTPDLLTIPQRG
jgi:hypothetical protein